jgi:hypothetical protein
MEVNMDDELKNIFSLRVRDIGASGEPVKRQKPSKVSKPKKNEDFAIFTDKDGNVVEPGSKDIVRGEIWTYDENGDVTRTYIGDSWVMDPQDDEQEK